MCALWSLNHHWPSNISSVTDRGFSDFVHVSVIGTSEDCRVDLSVIFSGVNLLVGTESGLMLLDRSGQGKVYPLISRRRFQQMDVLEGLNVLVTISGNEMHDLCIVKSTEGRKVVSVCSCNSRHISMSLLCNILSCYLVLSNTSTM